MDVLTFIDLLKLNLEKWIKLDWISLDNIECYNKVDDDDNDEHSIAHALLQEVSGAAYSGLSNKMIKETNIDQNIFPSQYKHTKPRSEIESFTYGKTDTNTTSITAGTLDSLTTIDTVIDSVKDGKNHHDV